MVNSSYNRLGPWTNISYKTGNKFIVKRVFVFLIDTQLEAIYANALKGPQQEQLSEGHISG